MNEFVVNVVNHWLWLATILYISLIAADRYFFQLFSIARLNSFRCANWIVDMLSILVASNQAIISNGIYSIGIPWVIKILPLALIYSVPVFGERHNANHTHNILNPVLFYFILSKNGPGIAVVVWGWKVFFVISIMQ
mgnify:CR=1 FL=1